MKDGQRYKERINVANPKIPCSESLPHRPCSPRCHGSGSCGRTLASCPAVRPRFVLLHIISFKIYQQSGTTQCLVFGLFKGGLQKNPIGVSTVQFNLIFVRSNTFQIEPSAFDHSFMTMRAIPASIFLSVFLTCFYCFIFEKESPRRATGFYFAADPAAGDVWAMVPWADFFNYSPSGDPIQTAVDRGVFRCKASTQSGPEMLFRNEGFIRQLQSSPPRPVCSLPRPTRRPGHSSLPAPPSTSKNQDPSGFFILFGPRSRFIPSHRYLVPLFWLAPHPNGSIPLMAHRAPGLPKVRVLQQLRAPAVVRLPAPGLRAVPARASPLPPDGP